MSDLLKNKEIVLGVCGGIAAYKAVAFTRHLVKAGSRVRVVMTRAAERFVGPMTFEALSGYPVWTRMFDRRAGAAFPHIAWAESANAVVIIPATGNIIGKIANGIADDALTTLLLAVSAPVLVCPSMNVRMYENPRVQKNMAVLREEGMHLVEAASGPLACGEEGIGRLADLETIMEGLMGILSVQDLKGSHLLVTAGPTREFMDPVRFVSNPSSGKMGYALARVAKRRGADVVLVSGPTCLSAPQGVEFIRVQSAQEMYDAVMGRVTHRSIVIKAAAVCDWRPTTVYDQKLKKEQALAPEIAFERTPDILKTLGEAKTDQVSDQISGQISDQVLVGFAAETENVTENAAAKMGAKNLDMIVANPVGSVDSGFGADTNQATLLFKDGDSQSLPLYSKERLAEVILDKVVEMRAKA